MIDKHFTRFKEPISSLIKAYLLLISILIISCQQSDSKNNDNTNNSFEPPRLVGQELYVKSQIPDQSSQDCSSCHQKQYNDWLNSQHAFANRLVSKEKDQQAFSTKLTRKHGNQETSFQMQLDRPVVTVKSDPQTKTYHPEAVIGISPEIQYLIPLDRGRWQVLDEAYDPHKNEWFNVFGDEVRESKEWGHWTNRGNNWNSQCAFCHMTGLRKNYSAEKDSYNTTWSAMGINCSQCHGDMSKHAKDPKLPSANITKTPSLVMDNCASCHSRREELDDEFQTGKRYHDHYRISLADTLGNYYPDGQQQAENFVHGSFMFSRMGHKGVTCQDCHDSHSAKLKIPLDNNALCLSCHAEPAKKGAKPIDPKKHSHHSMGSIGNSCVECHMPKRTYMQRDPRRDHFFGVPDPYLTKVLNVPNACNQCHIDKSVDWALEWTDKWYGKKMDRRSRRRALIIDRAQRGDSSVVSDLLEFAKTEEIDLWRATLVQLLKNWSVNPEVAEFLKKSLNDPSPDVRSSAIQGLERLPEMQNYIKSLRNDSSKLVRIDATISTVTSVENSDNYFELVKYLNNMSDQPTGLLKQAQLYIKIGRNDLAEDTLKKMVTWDPSAVSYSLLGQFYHANNQKIKAIESYTKSSLIDPNNAEYPYTIALLLAEDSKVSEAILYLEKAVQLQPDFGRAWYNLGLAYAEQDKLKKAISALDRARTYLPNLPEIPYALATVYLRLGDLKQAQIAITECLKIDANYQPARELLKSPQE